MSHRIIALIALVVALAVVGTAGAATSGYWHHSSSSYDCQGAPSVGLVCTAGNYQIMISRNTLGMFYGTGKSPTPIWGCKSNRSMYACTDYRP